MRVAILGSGGVGGYFGGRLAARGVDVAFVARGAHLAAMRERGLRIRQPGRQRQLAGRHGHRPTVGHRAGRRRVLRREAVRHRIGPGPAAPSARPRTRWSYRSRTASRASTSWRAPSAPRTSLAAPATCRRSSRNRASSSTRPWAGSSLARSAARRRSRSPTSTPPATAQASRRCSATRSWSRSGRSSHACRSSAA